MATALLSSMHQSLHKGKLEGGNRLIASATTELKSYLDQLRQLICMPQCLDHASMRSALQQRFLLTLANLRKTYTNAGAAPAQLLLMIRELQQQILLTFALAEVDLLLPGSRAPPSDPLPSSDLQRISRFLSDLQLRQASAVLSGMSHSSSADAEEELGSNSIGTSAAYFPHRVQRVTEDTQQIQSADAAALSPLEMDLSFEHFLQQGLFYSFLKTHPLSLRTLCIELECDLPQELDFVVEEDRDSAVCSRREGAIIAPEKKASYRKRAYAASIVEETSCMKGQGEANVSGLRGSIEHGGWMQKEQLSQEEQRLQPHCPIRSTSGATGPLLSTVAIKGSKCLRPGARLQLSCKPGAAAAAAGSVRYSRSHTHSHGPASTTELREPFERPSFQQRFRQILQKQAPAASACNGTREREVEGMRVSSSQLQHVLSPSPLPIQRSVPRGLGQPSQRRVMATPLPEGRDAAIGRRHGRVKGTPMSTSSLLAISPPAVLCSKEQPAAPVGSRFGEADVESIVAPSSQPQDPAYRSPPPRRRDWSASAGQLRQGQPLVTPLPNSRGGGSAEEVYARVTGTPLAMSAPLPMSPPAARFPQQSSAPAVSSTGEVEMERMIVPSSQPQDLPSRWCSSRARRHGGLEILQQPRQGPVLGTPVPAKLSLRVPGNRHEPPTSTPISILAGLPMATAAVPESIQQPTAAIGSSTGWAEMDELVVGSSQPQDSDSVCCSPPLKRRHCQSCSAQPRQGQVWRTPLQDSRTLRATGTRQKRAIDTPMSTSVRLPMSPPAIPRFTQRPCVQPRVLMSPLVKREKLEGDGGIRERTPLGARGNSNNSATTRRRPSLGLAPARLRLC